MGEHSTFVCFALKEEAGPFQKVIKSHPDIKVIISGMGQANAEKALYSALAAGHARQVFTCGLAGGLSPELKLGDVIFETSDFDLFSRLSAAGAIPVKFHCSDAIATTVAEKQEVRDRTGADAVEMESGAIQSICSEQEIPCVTLRVISDTAHEDLPLDFNKLTKPDKTLHFGKLLWAIFKSPGKIAALIRLQKKTKYASRQLAAVLQQITVG